MSNAEWNVQTQSEDTKNLVQGTKAWFQAREKIPCTASNIGAVFGESPFSNPSNVAQNYDGESTFFGNSACRYGSWSEDVAIKKVEEVLGLTIKETGLWINSDTEEGLIYPPTPQNKEVYYRFLTEGIGGSPDGLIMATKSPKKRRKGSTNNPKILGCIEVKCTHSNLYPKHLKKTKWYCHQVQMNAILTKVPFCLFISYTPLGLGVWKVERCDLMHVTRGELLEAEVCLNENHLEQLIEMGLYDDEKEQFVGYKKVLFHVLFQFYVNCKMAKDKRMDWNKWQVENHRWMRIVNKLHQIAIENAEELYLQQLEKKECLLSVKRTNWTSLLLWQMNFIQNHQIDEMVSVERFGLVSSDLNTYVEFSPTGEDSVNWKEQKVVVHQQELMPGSTIPFPTTGMYLYVDIFYMGRVRGGIKLKRKQLEIDLSKLEENESYVINYGKWEKKKSLPTQGYVLITLQDDQKIAGHFAGEWNPKPDQDHWAVSFPMGGGTKTLLYTNDEILSFQEGIRD